MIVTTRLRTLTLDTPSQPGRAAHVSAASGLVRAGEYLHVVADDENHLGIFPATGGRAGVLARIAEGVLPLDQSLRKRRKPDFESLAHLPAFAGRPHGMLLALGSCSKPNRCSGVALGLDARGALDGGRATLDLTPLRDALESRFGHINIEGAVVSGEELVLLQRANKGDPRNARIRVRLDRVIAAIAGAGEVGIDALLDIHEHDLGAIGDVPLGFSDGAALPGGRIAFTAIAEDTSDSYHDGACVGAAIGVVDAKGKVERLERIEDCPTPGRIGACHKVEGIEVTPAGGEIHVLLVTDADDPRVPATLLEARLPA